MRPTCLLDPGQHRNPSSFPSNLNEFKKVYISIAVKSTRSHSSIFGTSLGTSTGVLLFDELKVFSFA